MALQLYRQELWKSVQTFSLPQPTHQFGHNVLLVLLAQFGQIYYLFSMFQKDTE